MTDPRMQKLVDLLVGYSCAVKPGEHVLVEAIDIPGDSSACWWPGIMTRAADRVLLRRAVTSGSCWPVREQWTWPT